MQEVRERGFVFRFGSFEADTATGELRKHGLRLKLQDQPFRILITLLDRPGEVISRDEIRRKLWGPETFVDFEQGLGTAVKKLRQALSDDAETPKYIETLPKRGYRFIAAVERAVSRESPFIADSLAVTNQTSEAVAELEPEISTTKILVPKGRRTGSRWFTGTAVTLAFLAGTLVALLKWEPFHTSRRFNTTRDVTQPAERYTSRPLATLPGGEYEPALSPDGKTIAFVWGREGSRDFHIYTQAIDVGSPIRLTNNSSGEGSPAWSPDGRYLAFITCTDNVQASGLYIVPISGGAQRKVTSIAPRLHIFDRQIEWSPDGNLLALVDKSSNEEPSAIYVLSLNDGAKRRLTMPHPASPGHSGPVFSPDGTQIAFRRTQSIGNTDLYVVRSSGGEPRRVTFDQRFTSGHAWSRDGQDLVFASKRSGPIGLWRLKLASGLLQPIPGTEGVHNLAIARSGDRLVYSKYLSDSNIWETNLRIGGRRRVLSSTRNERSPQYSPDGTRIAFRSDRVWWMKSGCQIYLARIQFGSPTLVGR